MDWTNYLHTFVSSLNDTREKVCKVCLVLFCVVVVSIERKLRVARTTKRVLCWIRIEELDQNDIR